MRFPVPSPILSLRCLLAAWMGHRTTRVPLRRKRGTPKSVIESLEPRELLSATHLAFGSIPATGFLGSPFGEVVIVVEDAGATVVTSDNSRIRLTIASGPNEGKVLGTVNAVAGAATFKNIRLAALGSYTLTATDISEPSIAAATSGSVLIEAAPLPTSLVISSPASNDAGATISTVTVTIMDQYSHSFTAGHARISLALDDPATGAKLLGKLSETAVNGVATFTGVSLNQAGTFQLRATEGSGDHALAMTTQTFTLTAPAVATSLAFDQDATDVTAGATMTPGVTVKVLDQYGNTVTRDHSVLKLTDPTGPQSKVFTAHVVDGIATFSKVSFEQAGTYQLRATDARTTDGHAIAFTDLTTFTVSAAAADHLVFQQIPANHVAHAGPFVIKAAIEDTFGNVVSSNSSTVTLGLASGPSGATLNLTEQAAAGIVTFSDVIFTGAGHYRLEATDGALKAAKSAPVTLT